MTAVTSAQADVPADLRLVCRTRAGLCNRLKCLVSSQRIAQLTGRRLQLHWPANDRCGARFEELFETDVEEVHSLPDGPIVDRYGFVEERSSIPVMLLHTWRFALTREEWDSGEATLDFQYDQGVAHRQIAKDIHRLLCDLRPAATIAARVAQVVSAEFTTDVIGVHVRRGDHALARATSTDGAFERLLQELLSASPTSRVFLATDCPNVRDRLLNQLGPRAFSAGDAHLDRGNAASIKAALVELLLLARCQHLVGSQSSTFTELAWWLGHWRPIQIAQEAMSICR